jgi:hypothetical protein
MLTETQSLANRITNNSYPIGGCFSYVMYQLRYCSDIYHPVAFMNNHGYILTLLLWHDGKALSSMMYDVGDSCI